MQGVEDHVRVRLTADEKIEAGECPVEKRAGDAVHDGSRRARRRRRNVEGAALIRGHAEILALDEKLNPIAEIFIERDLGDGRVDRDLQLRLVELPQRLLDDPVFFRAGVDEERIGRRVGGDPDALQHGLTLTAPGRGNAYIELVGGAAGRPGRRSRGPQRALRSAAETAPAAPARAAAAAGPAATAA